jgi:hypothetical protein
MEPWERAVDASVQLKRGVEPDFFAAVQAPVVVQSNVLVRAVQALSKTFVVIIVLEMELIRGQLVPV